MPELYLLTHSAGGIAATKIAGEERIERIICFGYPFKHPRRPEESYRTEHLASVTKPVLILQGYCDEYGSDPKALSHYLPPSISLETLDCDHNYEFSEQFLLEQTWKLVADFVGRPRHHEESARA
jgi:predicted alpha/beta-hydrolase family hydrolase